MGCSSFLFFSTLISCVLVGNAHPVIELNKYDRMGANTIILVGNSVSYINSTAKLFTSRRCFYIPPNLEPCNFTSYQESGENVQLKHESSEKKKDKLMNHNKKSSLQSPKDISETGKSLKQEVEHTIIYEIQICTPPRLPFDNTSLCTKEDLANKKNQVQQLYPFMINSSVDPTIVFPAFNLSGLFQNKQKIETTMYTDNE